MFFRLGILNVRRQLTRSTLVVLTLALAAISLTYSLVMKDIPPLRISPFLSQLTGGHILAIPFNWAGQRASDVTDSHKLHPVHLLASGTSWLEWFYPELYEKGFWMPSGKTPTEFFLSRDVMAMEAIEGVEAVVTTPTLRAVVRALGANGNVNYSTRIAPLTETVMVLARDRGEPEQYDLAATGLFINENAPIADALPTYKEPGIPIEIFLPKAIGTNKMRIDWEEAFEIPFAAYLRVPTRTVYWIESLAGTVYEEGVFKQDILWIGEESWQKIVAQVGGNEVIPLVNVTLRVSDLQVLDSTLARLQEAFPQYSFVNLNQVEDRVYKTGYLESFRRAPRSAWQRNDRVGLVLPVSLSHLFSYLLIMIAALLLSGHVLTGTAARNQEIGTLRTLGARRRDILVLGVAETMALTVIGVSIGFFSLRFVGLIMQLWGGQSVLAVFGGLLVEYGQILGLSLAASLFFTLFPIWRLSSIAPMEVLRSE